MSGYPNQPPQAWNSISAPQQFAAPPGHYPPLGQQYPSGQPQPGQQYAPPGQPQPGQQHASPGQPQPGQQYAPPGQPQPGQQHASPGQQYAPSQQYPQPGQQYPQPGQQQPQTGHQYQQPGHQYLQSGQQYPGQFTQGPPQPGFAYGQGPTPSTQSLINPTPTAPALSYAYPSYQAAPSAAAAAPPQVSNAQQIEWILTTPQQAIGLSDRAVVGGYEGYDGSPLWVIRARHEGDLIPGKLALKHQVAFVPWGGKENAVQQIEVCCARPEKIRWQETRDGGIPQNAVVAGNTSSGEPLYVGRAREQGSMTPGKVQPSHNGMYISFGGKEIAHKIYETMCYV